MNIESVRSQMRKGVLEYCILSIISKDEVYASDQELAAEFFQGFINTFWEVDIIKQQRYLAYLELKKEFDPE